MHKSVFLYNQADFRAHILAAFTDVNWLKINLLFKQIAY